MIDDFQYLSFLLTWFWSKMGIIIIVTKKNSIKSTNVMDIEIWSETKDLRHELCEIQGISLGFCDCLIGNILYLFNLLNIY